MALSTSTTISAPGQTIDRDAILNPLRVASNRYGETNDCTVLALAAAGNVTYEEAHAALKKHGRKNRKGPKAQTVIVNGQRHVGCHAFQEACRELGIGFRVMASEEFDAKTMTTAERDRKLSNGRFVAYVRGHVAAIVDGTVVDWTQGRRHRIRSVWQLTPAERKQRQENHEPVAMKRMRRFEQQAMFV